jgi:hypothetical protein
LSSCPLRAIVVASGDGSSSVVSFNQIVDGVNLNGVVQVVTSGGIGCSGSLLSDGFSILTSGHCITGSYGSSVPDYVTVSFLGPSGLISDTVTNYIVDPLWTGDPTQGGDLAILRLNQLAPSSATRYSLYTGIFTTSPILLAGFGQTGTGTTGATGGFGTLRQGQNRYDDLGGAVFTGWSDKMLMGDFDNGTTTNNALGTTDSDIPNEVDVSFGDSGGPSLYGGMLIGVHDLIGCFSASSTSACLVPPSVSESDRSYFGQIFADTSVAANASWIESAMVPEPASGSLVLLGLAVAGFLGRRTGRRHS